jgi:RNA polymerase sigma factor (sigma-70 family)
MAAHLPSGELFAPRGRPPAVGYLEVGFPEDGFRKDSFREEGGARSGPVIPVGVGGQRGTQAREGPCRCHLPKRVMDDNDNISMHAPSVSADSPFMGGDAGSVSAISVSGVRSRRTSPAASKKRNFAPRRPANGQAASTRDVSARSAPLDTDVPLAALAEYTRLARGREAELVQQIAELRQDLLALALEATPVIDELAQLRREVSRGEHPLADVLDLRGVDTPPGVDAFEFFCDEAARFHDALSGAGQGTAREELRLLLAHTPLGELAVMRLLGALRPAALVADAEVDDDELGLDASEQQAPELPTELEQRVRVAERRLRHAEGRFVQANQGLVAIVVKRYLGMGLSQSDLMQEGNIGLLRAVEKFDHRRGCRFSTYATWWIRQGVRRALANQARTIRLPVHAADARYALRQASNKMEARLGRVPSTKELADQTGLDTATVSKLMNLVSEPVSLEAPRGDDGDVFLYDSLSDPSARDPAEQAHQRDIKSKLESLVGVLSPREARMVRLRFGLDGRDERTLDEIGLEFSVTRERVRQLLGRALDKLRGASCLTPADA